VGIIDRTVVHTKHFFFSSEVKSDQDKIEFMFTNKVKNCFIRI
jgi:hypothetical protein